MKKMHRSRVKRERMLSTLRKAYYELVYGGKYVV